MASFQQVIITGHLGGDPEVRYSGSGLAIANFSIATSEQWTDKQSGEKQERTEWHRIVFFGRAAEVAGEYLKKGAQAMVIGKLRTEKYTDKDGIERYTTKVYGDELKMLGRASDNGGVQQRSERPQDRSTRLNQQQGGGSRQQSAPPQQSFDDDDIPFD